MIFLKALTAVRAYFFLPRSPYISEFVNVNKFEATRMMTGFFNKKTHPGALCKDFYKLLMLTESTSPVSALIFTKNIPRTIAPNPFCASTVPRTVTLLS